MCHVGTIGPSGNLTIARYDPETLVVYAQGELQGSPVHHTRREQAVRQLRFSVGVALLMAVFIVVLSGFVATTRNDVLLILLGFTLGLVAVYAIERLKATDKRRESDSA